VPDGSERRVRLATALVARAKVVEADTFDSCRSPRREPDMLADGLSAARCAFGHHEDEPFDAGLAPQGDVLGITSEMNAGRTTVECRRWSSAGPRGRSATLARAFGRPVCAMLGSV